MGISANMQTTQEQYVSPGITKCYSGSLGEIRSSRLYAINKNFTDTTSLSFKYVLQGRENYIIHGQHFSLEERQILFFSNGTAYQGIAEGGSLNKGLCIDLNTNIHQVAQLDVLGEEELFLFSPELRTQKICHSPERLHQLLKQVDNYHPVEEELFLEETMQEVSAQVVGMEKEFVQLIASVPAKNKTYKKELFTRLIRAKNYIQENRWKKLQLAEISREIGLSNFYLHRLFKHVFGKTPAQFQEMIRMSDAKESLKHYSVKETSYKIGYTDEAYFSRRFKLHFGMTPGQFARMVR